MGKQIFGDVYGEGITASYSQDWKTQKFSEGAWAYSTTADTDPLLHALLDATGNTYFAGDHLSHSVAWQHGAITAGPGGRREAARAGDGMMSPRTKVLAVVGLTAALVAPTAAVAGSKWSAFPPRGGETISVLPAGQDNPSIANGVAIGPEAAIYKTSGLGPSRLNTGASGERLHRHRGVPGR